MSALLFALSATAASGQSQPGGLPALQQQLADETRARVEADLQQVAAVTTLQAALAGMQSTIKALQETITILATDNSKLLAEIAALKTSISKVASDAHVADWAQGLEIGRVAQDLAFLDEVVLSLSKRASAAYVTRGSDYPGALTNAQMFPVAHTPPLPAGDYFLMATVDVLSSDDAWQAGHCRLNIAAPEDLSGHVRQIWVGAGQSAVLEPFASDRLVLTGKAHSSGNLTVEVSCIGYGWRIAAPTISAIKVSAIN